MDIDIEKQKENFKNHVAEFKDLGNIIILDFKEPGTSHYRIRFLFEEDYYRLHISGDLGELIATNYNNMTYEGFSDFVHDTGYFERKIDCHSRRIYTYDEDKARKQLLELIEEYELKEEMSLKYDWESEEDSFNDVLDEILSDFDSDTGISSCGYDELSNYIEDAWEYTSDLGKENTGILELYMLAFDLAQKQLVR